jgi:lipoyl(octanoyl) transferase
VEKVIFEDLKNMPYAEAWELQRERHRELIDRKLAQRNPEATPEPQRHYLLFCEHPPVYTLGKSGDLNNLLLNEAGLQQHGIDFFKINRGGDITYHGWGQIVGYPIFDMDCFFTDVHKYVRYLEEVVIRTLADYGLQGTRIEGSTGVWLQDDKPPRKICAIGIHMSRWVTMHGFAFNVNTNLEHFGYIIPCGITDKAVTSLHLELGRTLDFAEVKDRVKYHFKTLFGFEYETETT